MKPIRKPREIPEMMYLHRCLSGWWTNQPAAKNSEGMIHDKYNPPDNLQSTLIYPPPTRSPLKASISDYIFTNNPHRQKRIFNISSTPLAARVLTAYYHSTQQGNLTTTQVAHSSTIQQPHPSKRPSLHSQNNLRSRLQPSANPQN